FPSTVLTVFPEPLPAIFGCEFAKKTVCFAPVQILGGVGKKGVHHSQQCNFLTLSEELLGGLVRHHAADAVSDQKIGSLGLACSYLFQVVRNHLFNPRLRRYLAICASRTDTIKSKLIADVVSQFSVDQEFTVVATESSGEEKHRIFSVSGLEFEQARW